MEQHGFTHVAEELERNAQKAAAASLAGPGTAAAAKGADVAARGADVAGKGAGAAAKGVSSAGKGAGAAGKGTALGKELDAASNGAEVVDEAEAEAEAEAAAAEASEEPYIEETGDAGEGLERLQGFSKVHI